MFLIEHLLQISPDNGNGLTEMAILAVIVSGLLLAQTAERFVKRHSAE